MAGDVATGIVVASHHLKRLVACKELHAGVDVATVWVFGVGTHLHIIGHVSIVEEMVYGLIVKMPQQGSQRVGPVVHVACDEQVMLAPVGVDGGEVVPARAVVVGHTHAHRSAIGIQTVYLTPTHTILISGVRLQPLGSDGEVLHWSHRVGVQYLPLHLYLPIYGLVIIGGLSASRLPDLYP